jgi:ribosomal protein S2
MGNSQKKSLTQNWKYCDQNNQIYILKLTKTLNKLDYAYQPT